MLTELSTGAVTFSQPTKFHPTSVDLTINDVTKLQILATNCNSTDVFNPAAVQQKEFKKGSMQ